MIGPRISLSTRITLLIVLPLLAQLFFFGALAFQVNQLEKEREAESRAVNALVLVNQILSDAMAAAGSLLMFRTNHEPFFLLEAESSSDSLDKHLSELKALQAQDPEGGGEIKGFTQVIDEMVRTFENTVDMVESSGADFEGIQVMGTMKSFLRRIKVLGDKTIQLQMGIRSKSLDNQRETRGKIQLVLGCATLFNAGLAIGLAVFFSITLGRRLSGLMDNAVRISLGRALIPTTVKGSDELAELDRVIHDLSADLALTRQKERALIDNTAEIICALDENLRITEVSPAVVRRLGYRQDEVRGVLFLSFVHDEDKEMAYERLSSLKGAIEEVEFETRIKSRDADFRFMEIVARWSDRDHSAFLILRDVTLRKEAERLKQEVLAMVSHDMRAPLSSVSITLDMILQGFLGDMNERGNRLVSTAQRSVGSLISMINDLLDVERFESFGLKLEYETVDSDTVVRQAIETLLPEANEKQVELGQAVDNIKFSADRERLNRVLVNLIGNAIKFTPKDGRIVISCRPSSTTGGAERLEFRISDTGPGIPPEKQASIFNKFSQAGTGSEGERRGSGLGLAIAKAIVEAHGGAIGVESTPGSGSTFWFTIPVEAGAACQQSTT